MGHDGPIGDVSIYQPAFSAEARSPDGRITRGVSHTFNARETSAASAPSLSREDGAEDEVIFDRVSLSMRWPLENRVVNSGGALGPQGASARERMARLARRSDAGWLAGGYQDGPTGCMSAGKKYSFSAEARSSDGRITRGVSQTFNTRETSAASAPSLGREDGAEEGRSSALVFYSSWNANRETGTQNS